MKRMKTPMLLAILSAGLLMTSCRKSAVEQLTTEESRIYITNRDSTVNFSSYKTFSIADSVVVVSGNSGKRQLNSTDAAFVNAFKTAMEAKGYTQVSKSQSPNLGVQISRIIQTTTGYVSYPDYYSYWDSYYWGYGGYGYGSPFWGVASYQVQEGMLSIDVVDLKNASSGSNLKVVWNGLIRGSGIFDAATANSQVQQLFSQSTYLGTN